MTKHTAEQIRDISEKVYKIRLVQDSGAGAVERMIADDKDGGKKLRGRAGAYDSLTRAYLQVLEVCMLIRLTHTTAEGY